MNGKPIGRTWLFIILILIVIFALWLGISILWEVNELSHIGIKATATLVYPNTCNRYTGPLYEFYDQAGQPQSFCVGIGQLPSFSPPTTIAVLYDPQDPVTVLPDSFVPLVAGILFSVFGIFIGLALAIKRGKLFPQMPQQPTS